MSVSNPKGRICDSEPGYWYFLAKEALSDAESAHEKGRRLNALFSYHMALEKLLKAICAKKGVLQKVKKTHNLVILAKKCGIYKDLKFEGKKFLLDISNLHVSASYPSNWKEHNTLNKPGYVKIVSRKTVSMFRVFRGILNDGTMHDTPGENRR